MNLIEDLNFSLDGIIKSFEKELLSLPTGRASSVLLENVQVECYGTKTPLIQLGHISVKDSRTLVVEPWDRTILKEIEKTISRSFSDFNCSSQDNLIYVSMPSLTEERRKEIVKLLHKEKEEARIRLRNLRDKVWKKICQEERTHQISENEKYKQKNELEKKKDEYYQKIEEISQRKEKEILTI